MTTHNFRRAKDKYQNQIYDTNHGRCVVTDYGGHNNVAIQFLDTGAIVTNQTMGNISKGLVKDPLRLSVMGIGCIGVGDFICRHKDGLNKGKMTFEYSAWEGMLSRVINRQNSTSYIGVQVYQPWCNFQIFANWVTKQIGYNVDGFNLDKDLLNYNSTLKMYHPDNCVLIPRLLNSAITDKKRFNSSGLTGVSQTKDGTYSVDITMYGKKVHLGTFNSLEIAFKYYKERKESYIRELGVLYKDQIDPRAFEATQNWIVYD